MTMLTKSIFLFAIALTVPLAANTAGKAKTSAPKELTIDKQRKVVIHPSNGMIDLKDGKSSTSIQGPYWGPDDKIQSAEITKLGNRTLLELKTWSSPAGTKKMVSELYWVVYDLNGKKTKELTSLKLAETENPNDRGAGPQTRVIEAKGEPQYQIGGMPADDYLNIHSKSKDADDNQE